MSQISISHPKQMGPFSYPNLAVTVIHKQPVENRKHTWIAVTCEGQDFVRANIDAEHKFGLLKCLGGAG
jgi:hypothetical protein